MVQARALEASFLSEMLNYAGVGKTPEGFGGGIGEEQFGSFLRDEQARQMVEKGGIGLAEQLFNAMTKGKNDAG
nr:rod-binding protein [Cypionkella aquatica]